MATKKKAVESPLDPDHPMATYRVACPVCRRTVWAGHELPPVEGEEILAGHDCPGLLPVEEQEPEVSREVGTVVEDDGSLPAASEVPTGNLSVDGPGTPAEGQGMGPEDSAG